MEQLISKDSSFNPCTNSPLFDYVHELHPPVRLWRCQLHQHRIIRQDSQPLSWRRYLLRHINVFYVASCQMQQRWLVRNHVDAIRFKEFLVPRLSWPRVIFTDTKTSGPCFNLVCFNFFHYCNSWVLIKTFADDTRCHILLIRNNYVQRPIPTTIREIMLYWDEMWCVTSWKIYRLFTLRLMFRYAVFDTD